MIGGGGIVAASSRAARSLAGASAGAAAGLLRLEHSFVGHADLRSDAVAAHACTTRATRWPSCRWSRWDAALRWPASSARLAAVAGLLAIALAPFLIHPQSTRLRWQEADVNSRARRAMDRAGCGISAKRGGSARNVLHQLRRPDRDLPDAGIPLRDTLTGDNDVEWDGAVARPDLFLHTDWAVVDGRR